MAEQNSNNNQNSADEDEIDLIALAKTLWNGRKTVIKTTLIFMVIGLFVAIFSEKEYTASTTFVSQTGESKVGGSLGGLAAMAGINLGGMGSDSGISPTLYPQILNSIPFQKELLQTPLTIEGAKEQITFSHYYREVYRPGLFGYLKKYTIGLPGLIFGAIKGGADAVMLSGVETDNNLFSITTEEDKLIKVLNKKIFLEINDDDGYVSISVNMPEAQSSAEMTLKVQQLLQRYVINFKIQKSKEQLEFIEERYIEVEKKYKGAQQNLAKYRDRNLNINTAMGNSSLELLQDEYDLVYGVFKELAKQLEAQYIQVTEDTPVFTVLKPVTVPIEKTKPKRGIILVIWTFLGVIVGGGVIIIRLILTKFKEQWIEKY